MLHCSGRPCTKEPLTEAAIYLPLIRCRCSEDDTQNGAQIVIDCYNMRTRIIFGMALNPN